MRYLQSSRRHVKDKHSWFYDIYFRIYDRDNYRGNSNEEDLNFMPEPVRGFEDGGDVVMEEQGPVSEQNKVNLFYRDFECDALVSSLWLGLRELCNTATKTTSFVNEK